MLNGGDIKWRTLFQDNIIKNKREKKLKSLVKNIDNGGLNIFMKNLLSFFFQHKGAKLRKIEKYLHYVMNSHCEEKYDYLKRRLLIV
jgi:hypothetical protein